MQKHLNLSKRALAMILVVAMLLPVFSSLSMLGVFASEEDVTTLNTTTDGKIVAENYVLTEEEKVLLKSGYLIGATHNYRVPTASDDLISIDTDAKTVTAKSFEKTAGYLWNPVSAEIVVNVSGTETVEETITFTNNKASYTTTATAFAVRVKYEVRKEISSETQELLLNAPEYLKQGVTNLDTLLDPKGDVMKALDSFATFSLTTLGADTHNPNAGTKGVLQLLLDDGYNYPFTFGPAGNQQTTTISIRFFDAIQTANEGMKYSEQEAAAELVAQLNANDGKLNLAVIAAEYAAASSKVEYLAQNAARVKEEVVKTYDLLYALTDDNGTLLGTLSWGGTFAVAGAFKTALETYVGYIVSLAGDKTYDKGALKVNEIGALEAYCADDAWKIVGKDILSDEVDYLSLDIMVGKLGDDLKGASAVVTNPLVVDTAVVQFNMSMYDVKVNVTLKVTEDELGSANEIVYEKKTVTLTLAQNATKQEILSAIDTSKAEQNALKAWNDVFVEGKFDRTVSALPDTLTGDIEYNITYTPKQYTVILNGVDLTLPYGYQLVLPVHGDATQSYDYWANGEYYAQGKVVTVVDDTVITRGEGKAYTPYAISALISNTYFAENAKASAILNSGALNAGLANDVANVRVPEAGDGLVTLNGSTLNASTYSSSYEGLSWVPHTYTVVTSEGSTTYNFNGATSVVISDGNYDRVEVTYRLTLANIASGDIEDLLALVVDLADEATAQKAALDRLNNYYGMMGKDTISVGILNGLKSFIPTCSDISEESKTNLINAIDGVINNCFEGESLRMYVLLTGYRNDGLAYYYKNSETFMNEINLLGEYLGGIVSEEEALRTVIDSLNLGDGISAQVDKISNLEGAIAELKAALTAPNAAIDTNSANLEKLTDALGTAGDVTYDYDGEALYLTAGPFVRDAETKVSVQVTVQGSVLPTFTFNKNHVLTANDVKAITDAIAATVAEKNLSDKYYSTNYKADEFAQSLIGKEAAALGTTSFVFSYEPKEYTVTIEGVGDATIGIGNLKVTLPASDRPLEYRYDYYVNGVKVNGSSYTFSMAQFDAIIEAGGFTIQRVVVDVKEEEYKNLINEFNEAIGSDLIVFALTKNNGEYAIILKLDTSNPGALAGAVKALAMKLVSYSYVAFEDNAFIYDDNGSKISFQALINTIMDSGFGSDTLIGMMNKNGVINNMKMPGEVISDKKVSAAGALLAETEFRLGLNKDQLSYQIPMYITMGAAPEYLTQLRNLLADQLGAYFTFNCENGKVVLSFNMPQKAYEAYLAVLLATDNVDITDVNAINEDVAIGFLENVIRPLMLSDASASSVENTLKKFGFNISFSEYEQAFEYIRNFYKKSSFAYDDLESTYDMGLDISIADYLESMNLGNLSGMIVEKDSGIHVDLGVSLVNLDKNYEALFFDIGAQGITNKFGLVEDIASKLGSMSGTAVVILLSDVDSNLTFKTTTVLNLNGFTVNGNIVGKGSVRIVDSVIDEDACGVVTGKVSGNVLIAGGKYTTDVSALIPNGYEQDADGVVSNKFMTIVRDEDGNINVEFNTGILATNSIPDIKTLIADIGVEILLNGFSANKLYFNDKKVYELTVDDLVGLYSATNRQEALMQKAMNMIDGQDLVDIINILLDNLTDFEGMKNVLDQDIANGTETPLFTYDLVTGTWGFSVEYVEEDDSITADITAGQDQKRKLNIVLTGDTADKQYMADLLGILAETAEKADVSVQVAAGKKNSTVTVNVGVIADVRFDFSKDAKYAVMLSVIMADGIGAPANAGLVAGLKTYFETDDMSDLTKAFNKLTLAQLVTAVENFQRNDTFAGMLNKLGLGGYDTVDADALEADIDRFAKVLGILARRVDVTGPAIKLESALDATTYAYTLDKENIKRSFNLDLVAGYSASFTAELVDVFASVKIFNNPDAPVAPTIDYNALNAEIQRIEALGLVEDEYTTESWAAFKAAYDAAKALLANATTQAEVDAALAALTAAYNALAKKTPVTPTIDYNALNAEIQRIEALGLVEDEYTAETWSTFQAAMDAAKALINNATTQDEVNAALAALTAAYNALAKKTPVTPTIDYSALEAEIQRIEALGLVESNYTVTSWSVFKAAMDAAKALINNATSQDEVNSALAALSAAVEGLKKAPGVTKIDYSMLRLKLLRLEVLGLVEDEYTETSWSVFKAAWYAAKALLDNANSQAEVDAVLATLATAFEGLTKKAPVAPTIDYSALDAEIQRIEALGLVEDEYTATSWSVFKAAMDAAKALINNATTQAEVDAALATLTAAANNLVKKAPPVTPTVIYTALQVEIQRIKGLGLAEDDYTPASWSVFKAAMDAAEALIDNANSQAEVDAALATLTAAFNALVKKTPVAPTIDYSALNAEIQRIEALNLVEDEYTATSWSVFKAAMDAAKALINNATTQAEVDAALATLTAAVDGLTKKPVAPTIDYNALQAEIQRIEALALVEDEYTTESWAAFKVAMDAAKALINNATTQAEVDAVLATLTAAANGLVKKTPVTPSVDLGALEAEIQRIEALALVEGEYTAESWAAYKAAYDAAKALLANATTQAEVDAALAALTAAANGLVKKTPVTPTIDYSALNAEIQRIEALALVEGDYTAESWTAFKAAMDAAKALIDNAGTQAEVDSVLAALTAAVNGLQKKAPVTPPVDGGDGPTEKPTDKEEDEGLGVIWIIIIVAVSIVVVAGVAAVIVLNIKKKKTTDSTPLVDYNIDDDNA